jgi:hypothetical protein
MRSPARPRRYRRSAIDVVSNPSESSPVVETLWKRVTPRSQPYRATVLTSAGGRFCSIVRTADVAEIQRSLQRGRSMKGYVVQFFGMCFAKKSNEAAWAIACKGPAHLWIRKADRHRSCWNASGQLYA